MFSFWAMNTFLNRHKLDGAKFATFVTKKMIVSVENTNESPKSTEQDKNKNDNNKKNGQNQ